MMIAITEPGIDLVMTLSACPVQVEGTVDDLFAYFRARGTTWTFTLATSDDGAVAGGNHPDVRFDFIGDYDEDGCGYCAGYMEPDVAERIIREQIAAFRAGEREG